MCASLRLPANPPQVAPVQRTGAEGIIHEISCNQRSDSPPQGSAAELLVAGVPRGIGQLCDRGDHRHGAHDRRTGDRPHRQFVQLRVARSAARALEPVTGRGVAGSLQRRVALRHQRAAADQRELAERFALKGADRWQGVAYTPGISGAPLLSGSAASFECFNRSRYEEGDHVIFVGEVERCTARAGASPLLFHGGRFYTEHPL